MKIVKLLLIAAAVAAALSTAPAAFAAGAEAVGPDATTSAFLAALNGQKGPGLETLGPAKARQVLVDAQNGTKVDLSGIDVSNRTIEQDGLSVPVTIVRPQGATGTLPVFVFIHGGGWVLGDFPTHERLVRDLVVQSGAVAVFVNYTPSPEAHYPVAINQAYAATSGWRARRGDRRRRQPPRGGRQQRRREHGGRGGADGEGQGRPRDPLPGADVAGDGPQLQHGFVQRVSARALPDAADDEVVLGRLYEERSATQRDLRVAAAREHRAVEGPAARADSGRAVRRAA